MTSFDIYNREQPDQPAAPAGLPSFDVYAKPAEARPAGPEVGYAEDIGKGIVGGLGRGATGLVGLPGTAGSLARWGLGKAGVPEEYLTKGAAIARHIPGIRALTGPNGAEVQKAVEGYTGEFYQPKTIPGQYASTGAEFAVGSALPGMGAAGGLARNLAARTVNTVAPAVVSETAGQLTKGTPYEPWARAIGGVAGGLAGAKAITPMAPAEGAYARAVGTLEAEGIPLTAGQRTGNKNLQYMESNAVDMPLIGGQAARLRDAPLTALDRTVTERIYPRAELRARGVPDDVNLPDPRVAQAGPEALGDNYTRLTQAPFVSNPRFQNRMTRAQDEYERLVMPHEQTAHVGATQDNIIDRLVTGQGRMPGDEYQSIRSQIGTRQRAPGINPDERHALTEYKRALDEAYLAGLSPADRAALMANNRRYALMKATQPAVDTATEHLSPAKLAQAVRARRGAQYSARRGDLDELAHAASVVMKPLPNSGTAARLAAQSGGGGTIGTAIGATVGGPVGAAIGFGIGAGAPLVAPGLATSRLGQAYLGNRALPQNARDILAQTLLQQGISQPSGIKRNEEEREKLRRIYIRGRN